MCSNAAVGSLLLLEPAMDDSLDKQGWSTIPPVAPPKEGEYETL